MNTKCSICTDKSLMYTFILRGVEKFRIVNLYLTSYLQVYFLKARHAAFKEIPMHWVTFENREGSMLQGDALGCCPLPHRTLIKKKKNVKEHDEPNAMSSEATLSLKPGTPARLKKTSLTFLSVCHCFFFCSFLTQ